MKRRTQVRHSSNSVSFLHSTFSPTLLPPRTRIQDEIGQLVFNPGATSAVTIPAKLLVAADPAAAAGGMIDVAEVIGGMQREMQALKDQVAALERAQGEVATKDEQTGVVVASDAFCAAWGAAMEAMTGNVGSCAFPTVWKSDVHLEGWMIPLLQYVVKIEGHLNIDSQHYLESLDSILPNLEEVTKYVQIRSNNGLAGNVTGFAKLEKVGEYVDINSNPNLKGMGDKLFPVLNSTGAGSVRIHNNVALTTLAGCMPMLGRVGSYVEISNNANLLTVGGAFPSLTVVGSHISIYTNAILASIAPSFGAAPDSTLALGGYLQVSNNFKLADVSGLHGIACTDVDNKCQMNWYGNYGLDQADVCGVWTSMGGAGPTTYTSTNCGGGGGNRPCFGSNPNTDPASGSGVAANCPN